MLRVICFRCYSRQSVCGFAWGNALIWDLVWYHNIQGRRLFQKWTRSRPTPSYIRRKTNATVREFKLSTAHLSISFFGRTLSSSAPSRCQKRRSKSIRICIIMYRSTFKYTTFVRFLLTSTPNQEGGWRLNPLTRPGLHRPQLSGRWFYRRRVRLRILGIEKSQVKSMQATWGD